MTPVAITSNFSSVSESISKQGLHASQSLSAVCSSFVDLVKLCRHLKGEELEIIVYFKDVRFL